MIIQTARYFVFLFVRYGCLTHPNIFGRIRLHKHLLLNIEEDNIMPNPFLVPIFVVWSVLPQIVDKILGTNIEQYFTQELLGEIVMAPYYWGLQILQNLFS